MNTHDDLDIVWLLTRALESEHGPQPASRARTTYQRAVYALQDWRQEHSAHNARGLLIAHAALARTNPELLPREPIDIDGLTLSAAAAQLADTSPEALFDAREWSASYDALDAQVEPDRGWDDNLVDQACALWEALLDALDLSCALTAYHPALAFALEALARPLVIGLGERLTPLLPACDLYRADAGTLHPELAEEPELLWVSSLMLHAVRAWERWALERGMSRSAASQILELARAKREKMS